MIIRVLLLPIFVLSPFVALCLAFMQLLLSSKSKIDKYLVFAVISGFIGLLNIKKEPYSDFATYLEWYKLADSLSFKEYIWLIKKEPLFMALTYVVNRLTLGSESIYVFVLSFLSYFLLLESLSIFHRKLNFSKLSFFTSVLVLVFFPYIFLLSAHLIRQFLAISIMAVVMSSFLLNRKFPIVSAMIATLIHSTAAIIFLLVAVTRRWRIDIFIRIFVAFAGTIIGVFSVFIFFNSLHGYLYQIPLLGYISYRVVNIGNSWTTSNLGYLSFVVLLFNVSITTFCSLQSSGNKNRYVIEVLAVINTCLLAFLLVNYKNTEIALRFSYLSYFLLVFTIYIGHGLLRKKEGLLASIFLTLMLPCWFVYKVNYGEWTYLDLQKLFYPLFIS